MVGVVEGGLEVVEVVVGGRGGGVGGLGCKEGAGTLQASVSHPCTMFLQAVAVACSIAVDGLLAVALSSRCKGGLVGHAQGD